MPAIFVIAGGAAAWAAYNWLYTPLNATQAEGEIEAKSVKVASLGKELRFKMPPIGSFDAILKRPIFAPSRRAAAGVSKAPIVNQELGVELLGIVGDEAEVRILLKPTDGGETVTLRVGEDFRGWAFTGIEDGQVNFENGDGDKQVLALDYEKAPAPTAQSRRDKRRKQAQQAQQGKTRLQAGVIHDEEEEGEGEEDEQNNGAQ